MFEPGISPCKAEFPDVKIKRQIIEHYLKDICNLTQQYGIYTIEFSTPNPNHRKYVIQTDDLELEFSKVFLEYIKSIQYHNSQRANSIFTNEVFAIIYSYILLLEKTENLKLQYVNRIETNTTHISNIQESDTDLVEKITEILNIYEKHPNFKGKPSFKKWCN